jgi:methyl-accepting chemotaxis protein PixJ
MITNLLKADSQNTTKNNDSSSSTARIDENTSKGTKIVMGIEDDKLSDSNTTELKTATPINALPERVADWWKRLSLQRKAIALGLALGIVPVVAVGGIAHHLASRSLMKQIVAEQESRTFDLRQKVSLFTNQIVDDAKTIADSPLLTDPQLSASISLEQKVAWLNTFIDDRRAQYDSIVVFDPQGNLLFQSKSPQPFDPQENYSDREYFQRAIATQAPAINDPKIAPPSDKNSLEVAAPIKESETGRTIAVVRLRMPLVHLEQIFQYIQAQGWEYKLIGLEHQVFAADEQELVGYPASKDFPELTQLEIKSLALADEMNDSQYIINFDRSQSPKLTQILKDSNNDKQKVLASYLPVREIEGLIEPGWGLIISRSLEEAFTPLQNLRLTFLLGTAAAALAVGTIAATIANRATRPILAAAGAMNKIGRGELDTHLEVEGKDELATLGTSINGMAKQLKVLVNHQVADARRSRILKDITLQLSRTLSSAEIFQLAVQEILPALQGDRAIFYSFEEGNRGKILAESIAGKWSSLLEAEIAPSNFLDEYGTTFEQWFDRVKAIPDIYQAGIKANVLKELEAFEIKASLVAPILVGKHLQGLLIVHQCDRPRQWQKVEIDFFAQLASQVVLALERTNLLEQQKIAQEQLQKQALELLMEIEPISRGDLTVRATVKEGEIGTLADSYNSTVESLRRIATQVQKVVAQMAVTTNNSDGFARVLSQRAYQQSEAIAAALNQIQTMTESIQAIANNAEQAEASVRQSTQTVAAGDEAINRTVEAIHVIRATVAETSKKVKRLGESSQKISKVVNLISSFAAQTNLLALNASLEASRAGQEGQNFAVVAEEVRLLAQQSAQATTEIEKLVASIQLDTREVATAMEEGTKRVVIGSKLVDETRQSLTQIAADSDRVSGSIAAIAQKTIDQSQASKTIMQTIAEVSAMASTTSTDAAQLSDFTKELLAEAGELEQSIRQFKV